jgi:hypothetical protein
MKASFVILGVAIIAIFFLNVTALNAQVTAPSTAKFTSKNTLGEDPDSVTVGSVMPYMTHTTNWGILKAYMDPSTFKWNIDGSAGEYKLLQSDGKTDLTVNDYHLDSLVSVKWIASKNYTISVMEKSNPKTGTTGTSISGCESIKDETLNVSVLPRPTVAWNETTTTIGGCGMDNQNKFLAVTLLGAKVKVNFSIDYYDLANNKTNTTKDSTFSTSNYTHTFDGKIRVPIEKGKYGKYEITITNITDKIATKCGVPSDVSDYPSNKITLIALPNPVTSPIEHITNL